MSGPGFTPSDLCSIRAATEQAEFVDTVRSLLSADGYVLADDHPLAAPVRDVARTLVEACFTWHHRDRYDSLCLFGGVCPMPILPKSGCGRSAIAISWTIRDLLLEKDWRATYSHTCQLVNAVPGSVLHTFGYVDRQFGTDGACLMPGHRSQGTEAGR